MTKLKHIIGIVSVVVCSNAFAQEKYDCAIVPPSGDVRPALLESLEQSLQRVIRERGQTILSHERTYEILGNPRQGIVTLNPVQIKKLNSDIVVQISAELAEDQVRLVLSVFSVEQNETIQIESLAAYGGAPFTVREMLRKFFRQQRTKPGPTNNTLVADHKSQSVADNPYGETP